MRILHFVSDIGIANGVMSVVFNYFKAMPNDIKFDIMYFKETDDSREENIRELGGRVYKVSPPSKLSFSKELNEFFKAHKNEYSAVHIHAPQWTAFIAHQARKCGIKKVIAHSHTAELSLGKKAVVNKILNIPTRFVADVCIAPSDIAGKVWFGKNYKLMKNAIDSDAYKFQAEIRRKKRSELKIGDRFAIIQIGKTTKPQKNHKFTFEIFAEWLKENPNSVLLLAGGEKTAETWEITHNLGIDKSVIFLGTRSDVNELLMAADAFVLPSTSEGLLIAAIEAQASGLSGIISDRVPREVCITENICALPLENSNDIWINKLKKISLDTKDRTHWSEKVKDLGWDIYDNAQKLIQIYGG